MGVWVVPIAVHEHQDDGGEHGLDDVPSEEEWGFFCDGQDPVVHLNEEV